MEQWNIFPFLYDGKDFEYFVIAMIDLFIVYIPIYFTFGVAGAILYIIMRFVYHYWMI